MCKLAVRGSDRSLPAADAPPSPASSTRTADTVGWVCSVHLTDGAIRARRSVDDLCPVRSPRYCHPSRSPTEANFIVLVSVPSIATASAFSRRPCLPRRGLAHRTPWASRPDRYHDRTPPCPLFQSPRPTPPPHYVRCNHGSERQEQRTGWGDSAWLRHPPTLRDARKPARSTQELESTGPWYFDLTASPSRHCQ